MLARNHVSQIRATRSPLNPLITYDSDDSLGTNINGPSVIRVPSWIDNPLGTFYMYFAHHSGTHIRLAYADDIHGRWHILQGGCLQLEQALSFHGHIASPDVHIDHATQRIRMYFHGPVPNREEQWTGVAHSKNGINFIAQEDILGQFYFRVSQFQNIFYAIAKDGNNNNGILYRSTDGISPFESVGPIVPMIRHAALLRHHDHLLIFHSRKGDAPERIVVSSILLSDNPHQWTASEVSEVIRPQHRYEGSDYPNIPSEYGATTEVQQLRDPCIFEDQGKIYLFYCVAGEMGIALAELEITYR